MSLRNGDEFHKESRNTAAKVRNAIAMRLLVTEFRQSINCRIGPYMHEGLNTGEQANLLIDSYDKGNPVIHQYPKHS